MISHEWLCWAEAVGLTLGEVFGMGITVSLVGLALAWCIEHYGLAKCWIALFLITVISLASIVIWNTIIFNYHYICTIK